MGAITVRPVLRRGSGPPNEGGVSSEGLHGDREILAPETLDRHRAISSLMEELEAGDWYDQRIAGANDPELKELLAHNRDEEKEHACMMIEWLRRHDDVFREELETYLFAKGSIIAAEEAATGGESGGGEEEEQEAPASTASNGSLGIGSLKG